MSRPIRIPPRTPAQWVSDERVQQCTSCRIEFSLMRRKHHCRGCGRIFCHYCSAHQIIIPTFVQHFIASTPTRVDESLQTPKRVCNACFSQFHGARRSRTLVTIFAALPLDWNELVQLSAVSTLWRDAIKTICLLWRSILIRLPGVQYSRLEYHLLRTHLSDIAGHSKWAVRAYTMGLRPILSHRTLPCTSIGCEHTCQTSLSIIDLLELYHGLPPDAPVAVENDLFRCQLNICDEQLKTLAPWFAQYAMERPQIAALLRKQIIASKQILWAWCNELSIHTESIAQELKKMFITEHKQEWKKSRALIETVEQILDTRNPETRADIVHNLFGFSGAIPAPWDPSIGVAGIDLDGIQELTSASKPTIIPLRTTSGVVRILYKREDVRRDQVTMTVAYWINQMTQLHVPTYDVLPLSPSHGWIVMLENTSTLYEIRQQGKTLQNVLLDRLPHLTIAAFRERFAASCAAACVLCYVMGVGDRHLSNMLITEEGHLLHIDFTYILGDDPKYVRTEMRVTKDMLDVLGGKNTPTFRAFKRQCRDAYQIIRMQAPFWYALLTRVAEPNDARRHVLSRLVPGQNMEEADELLVEIVERSSSGSWGQAITDTSHAWSTWARTLLPSTPTMFKMDL